MIETEDQIILDAAGGKADKLVIWMHGLGADGSDFVPIVNELDFQGLENTRFIFPHADVLPVTINGGMSMRAWYDILQADLSRRVDGPGVLKSVERIAHLVSEQADQGIAVENMVLAGFSQGGVIALHTALQFNLPLAGVMALSTYLPIRETLEDQKQAEAFRQQAVFLAHGIDDGVVPYAEALSSLDWLRSHGHQVEWKHYPMMHAVCAEEIADINQWLGQVFNKS